MVVPFEPLGCGRVLPTTWVSKNRATHGILLDRAEGGPAKLVIAPTSG